MSDLPGGGPGREPTPQRVKHSVRSWNHYRTDCNLFTPAYGNYAEPNFAYEQEIAGEGEVPTCLICLAERDS